MKISDSRSSEGKKGTCVREELLPYFLRASEGERNHREDGTDASKRVSILKKVKMEGVYLLRFDVYASIIEVKLYL